MAETEVKKINGRTLCDGKAREELNKKQPIGNYITEESDPTVPAWAKQPTKPSYTAKEVGARPDTWTPTASDVGADPIGSADKALADAKAYTDKEVANIPTPDVSGQISTHNTNAEAHNDIRLLIAGLTTRLNALADSDDTTLDQMSELVAYIKSNRTLIESVTTDKVNVSDIIDDLETNVSNKPLSAAQGARLYGLIQEIWSADYATTAWVNRILALELENYLHYDGTQGDPPANALLLTGNGTQYLVPYLDGYLIKPYNLPLATEDTLGAMSPEDKVKLNSLSEEIADLSLGIGVDGRIYLLRNGVAQGNGIELPSSASGDVIGNIGDGNIIMLSGDIPDGTYTLKYEMENGNVINIGDMVLDSNVYYSVTKNLTYCTINNSAIKVIEGESYSATITANSGYELSSVVVTMGGTDITSSAVSGGNISIASVTGDVDITAVAEAEVVATNFCVPLGDGWISGGRCSSAGADREDSEAYALTNYIAAQNGDIVYVKNLDITTITYSGLYKADKTAIGGFTFPTSGAESGYVKDVDLSGEWEQFTIDNANAGYVRICGVPTSGLTGVTTGNFEDRYDIDNLNIIVNIKRNGTWL